jgi:hypothetical protein
MTFLSGPFNIEQGNSAQFVVEFLDTTGVLTVPPSAAMTVVYTNTSFSPQTDSVTMTSVGSFFTGTWSSTSAGLGLATWTATALPSSVQAAQGQIRVIQRKAN